MLTVYMWYSTLHNPNTSDEAKQNAQSVLDDLGGDQPSEEIHNAQSGDKDPMRVAAGYKAYASLYWIGLSVSWRGGANVCTGRSIIRMSRRRGRGGLRRDWGMFRKNSLLILQYSEYSWVGWCGIVCWFYEWCEWLIGFVIDAYLCNTAYVSHESGHCSNWYVGCWCSTSILRLRCYLV